MYLSLFSSAPRKKQTTLPPFAYVGCPYQSFGERAGAIRFRHRGDRREHGAFPVRLVRALGEARGCLLRDLVGYVLCHIHSLKWRRLCTSWL
jgi:hypothetical protein